MTLSSPILQQNQVLTLLRTAKYRQLEGVDQTVAYDIQGTVKNVLLSGCRNIIACNIGVCTALDTDNFFPKNSSNFQYRRTRISVRTRTDFRTIPHGFSAQYRAEESRQEFRADLCGKWRKPLVS